MTISADSHFLKRMLLPEGALVLTLDGELPVEFLQAGDRIVCRRGARRLNEVNAFSISSAYFVSVERNALGAGPSDQIMLLAGQRIHSPNDALSGNKSTSLVTCLFDLLPKPGLTLLEGVKGRFYQLLFACPETVYVNGLQLESAWEELFIKGGVPT
jgi:hypothetical protein